MVIQKEKRKAVQLLLISLAAAVYLMFYFCDLYRLDMLSVLDFYPYILFLPSAVILNWALDNIFHANLLFAESKMSILRRNLFIVCSLLAFLALSVFWSFYYPKITYGNRLLFLFFSLSAYAVNYLCKWSSFRLSILPLMSSLALLVQLEMMAIFSSADTLLVLFYFITTLRMILIIEAKEYLSIFGSLMAYIKVHDFFIIINTIIAFSYINNICGGSYTAISLVTLVAGVLVFTDFRKKSILSNVDRKKILFSNLLFYLVTVFLFTVTLFAQG